MALNYGHLRYFHAVAQEGHLGQAADKLNVSQSALSMQIKALEARLGVALFDRVGRRLVLTEAGRIAQAHADEIFSTGNALLATLSRRASVETPLRVGALSTLSRNFQMTFLAPLLAPPRVPVRLRSGGTATLLAGLEDLSLDVVLTTELPSPAGFAARRIADQSVGLHGVPHLLTAPDLPTLLQSAPLILPTDTAIRTAFSALTDGLEITVAAEVDDMAMLRLLTRAGIGVAVAPSVVLADEIAAGGVATAPFELGISEPFYAVTRPRQFAHPALKRVLPGPA